MSDLKSPAFFFARFWCVKQQGTCFIFTFVKTFMHASAYSYIMFGEFMSMGRRIAREIKNAVEEDKLEVVIT